VPSRLPTIALIPAYNEEASVGSVVAGVRSLGLPALVIDDGSTDATAETARKSGARVLRLIANLGVGAALRAGFRYAVAHKYQRVVQIDADLQHDPSSIPRLLEAADAGAQLVIGSRFGSNYDAGARRYPMKLLARLVSTRTGVPIDDPTSGFKVVTEPLLSEFARSYPTDYLGDTVEALFHASAVGARIAQVDVTMSVRRTGQATTPWKAAAHFARVLFAVGSGRLEGPNR
jgi:glycosyltransferase involved in cell wall biosynthesis